MNPLFENFGEFFRGDRQADRIVPPTKGPANLTVLVAMAMAFLSVLTLAMSVTTGQLADRWSSELARTATIRISAPEGQVNQQSEIVLGILATTPGVKSARLMEIDEQRALLEPWFGPDLPLETLPIPRLIEIVEDHNGPDMRGLRLRLQAEAPGAILDDHKRWRTPLTKAAARLRLYASLALCLILFSTIAMVTLAVQSSLYQNGQVIDVLRLVGATDRYIAKAFVRRYALRAFSGSVLGTMIGALAIILIPRAAPDGAFLSDLGFRGWNWVWLLGIPVITLAAGFVASRYAAFRRLSESS